MQGQLRAVESLLGDERGAASVQVREGRARTLDGPFSESKEMIGGFFLVDCASLEEATALAAQCPRRRLGDGGSACRRPLLRLMSSCRPAGRRGQRAMTERGHARHHPGEMRA